MRQMHEIVTYSRTGRKWIAGCWRTNSKISLAALLRWCGWASNTNANRLRKKRSDFANQGASAMVFVVMALVENQAALKETALTSLPQNNGTSLTHTHNEQTAPRPRLPVRSTRERIASTFLPSSQRTTRVSLWPQNTRTWGLAVRSPFFFCCYFCCVCHATSATPEAGIHASGWLVTRFCRGIDRNTQWEHSVGCR